MILFNDLIVDRLRRPKQKDYKWIQTKPKEHILDGACLTHVSGVYLVLVCALLELFKLVVQDSEMPSDALYPSVQTSVLTVLGVEIIFVPLPLLRRADHRVFPIGDIKRGCENTQRLLWAKRPNFQSKALDPLRPVGLFIMLMIRTRPVKNEVKWVTEQNMASNFLYKVWKKLPSMTNNLLSYCTVKSKKKTRAERVQYLR